MKFKDIFLTTTDTVPGIGAPMNKVGEEALYEIKKRPKEKKIIIMVGSIDQARKLNGWDENAEELAKEYWPGNVTLALTPEVAVRMPNVKGLCELIIKKGPVYMTSANISGETQLTFEEAKKKFKEIKEHYYFSEGNGIPSTIIRVKDKKVLR